MNTSALGKEYYTIYQPITTPAGDTIGIAYVGVFKDVFEASVAELQISFAIAGLACVVIVSVLAALIFRAQVKPLGDIVASVESIASGQDTSEVPH